MKRIALAVLIVGSLFAGGSRGAFAEPRFNPNPNSAVSCGLGPELAQFLRALPFLPGASEARFKICPGDE